MDNETSDSGDPIRRYDARPEGWQPPDMSDSSMEAITAHIEEHIGPIATVWHEIVSDRVHIDVHQIAPSEARPYWTLVTTGMSDLPMPAPAGNEAWRYSELMICLPREWPMDKTSFRDEANYWPIRWLKMLARFPHEYKAWLSLGHSMPNGDPAAPIDSSVPFDGIVLLRPKTVSREFWTLEIRPDKIIQFLSIVPVYPGEMELKLKHGAQELDHRLEQAKVTELVDRKRRDVSRSAWWKFW